MKKLLKGMKILLIVFLACLLVFLILMGILFWAEKQVPEPGGSYDAIVVLGAQVKSDGTLSLQLQNRLEKACEAWKTYGGRIIVCGAQGKNEPAPEGEVMRAWLIQQGIPKELVISETQSFNTWQNLENAKALLSEGENRIILVTSDYHLPRALAIAKSLGFEADGLGSPTLPQYWIKNHAREVLAWGKYFLQKIGLK